MAHLNLPTRTPSAYLPPQAAWQSLMSPAGLPRPVNRQFARQQGQFGSSSDARLNSFSGFRPQHQRYEQQQTTCQYQQPQYQSNKNKYTSQQTKPVQLPAPRKPLAITNGNVQNSQNVVPDRGYQRPLRPFQSIHNADIGEIYQEAYNAAIMDLQGQAEESGSYEETHSQEQEPEEHVNTGASPETNFVDIFFTGTNSNSPVRRHFCRRCHKGFASSNLLHTHLHEAHGIPRPKKDQTEAKRETSTSLSSSIKPHVNGIDGGIPSVILPSLPIIESTSTIPDAKGQGFRGWHYVTFQAALSEGGFQHTFCGDTGATATLIDRDLAQKEGLVSHLLETPLHIKPVGNQAIKTRTMSKGVYSSKVSFEESQRLLVFTSRPTSWTTSHPAYYLDLTSLHQTNVR